MNDSQDARVAKALAEVHFVQTLIGPHESTEAVLAAEVRRLHSQRERIVVMIKSWREVAREQRACAKAWREQGESFSWHAIRTDAAAEILETQATLLESIITTL